MEDLKKYCPVCGIIETDGRKNYCVDCGMVLKNADRVSAECKSKYKNNGERLVLTLETDVEGLGFLDE